MQGTLAQLNVSQGGVPKRPVLFARVSKDGVDGDAQRNLKYHGGPDRALCLYSVELYDWLRGEGVDLCALAAGDRLRVGDCLIELTDVREPCRTLKKWDERFPKLILGRSGWVAKVIEEAVVKPGDAIEVSPARWKEA